MLTTAIAQESMRRTVWINATYICSKTQPSCKLIGNSYPQLPMHGYKLFVTKLCTRTKLKHLHTMIIYKQLPFLIQKLFSLSTCESEQGERSNRAAKGSKSALMASDAGAALALAVAGDDDAGGAPQPKKSSRSFSALVALADSVLSGGGMLSMLQGLMAVSLKGVKFSR